MRSALLEAQRAQQREAAEAEAQGATLRGEITSMRAEHAAQLAAEQQRAAERANEILERSRDEISTLARPVVQTVSC